jgi:hypothetical protein
VYEINSIAGAGCRVNINDVWGTHPHEPSNDHPDGPHADRSVG